MFNISEEYRNAIVADVRDMPYRVTLAGGITFTQDDIPNMTLTESMGDSNGIAIGSANAAELNLTLRNPGGIDYNNMLVEPESGLLLEDGTIEWIPLGKFWVTKVSTSDDYKTVKLSCADGMYLLSGDYTSKLGYPTTLKAVVNEIISLSGVEFVEPEVWPDIVARVKPEGMTYRSAIGYVAGCMGRNARFNRNGQLEFVWYTDTGITIERETQYMNGMTKLHDKPLAVSVQVTGAKEKYRINIVAGDGGKVSASPSSNILEGDLVSLSVRPNKDYELASISVYNINGVSVPLTADAEGVGYTFIQPDSNVTVIASFRAASGGPYKLTVRSNGNGTLTYQGSGLSKGDNYFHAGSEVMVAPSPDAGYELSSFYTVPAGIEVSMASRLWYSFIMPESDVTLTANFREAITFPIYRDWGSGEGYIAATNETTGGNTFHEGDLVNMYIAPAEGYAFDHYECSVEMTQIDEHNYQFIMPAEAVDITVYFKFSEDESKTGLYSWLQLPQAPPTNKPYWAVFYKHDLSVPVCQRFHLVWFDSWTATSYSNHYDKRYYNISFDGYYHCGSKNTGHLPQAWDTSVWSGNGAPGSTLEWEAHIGFQYAGYVSTLASYEYCLLASNAHLYYNYTMLFEACPNAIQFPGKGYVVDGMDIRERDVLSYYKCPDTFSTPAPAANWMILNCKSQISMEPDGFGGNNADGIYVLFFDSISIENIGAAFSNFDEDFYVATVTNGHYVSLCYENSSYGWGTLYDISEGMVIGLRSPLNSQNSAYGGLQYYSGVLASNIDLWSSGDLLMYRNDCKICDCASTFSLRRDIGSVTDPVTLTYTNPMIYEKMVPAISEAMQGITYTPAKLKHRGNPAFQAGDIVSVPDGDGVYHNVLIMQQTMNFGGGMNSEISCPGQTAEVRQFASNSPSTAKIKEEVALSTADIERRISENNAYIFSAIYRSLESTKTNLNEQINGVNDSLYSALETVQKYEDRIYLCEKGISNLNAKNADIEEAISYIEQDIINIKLAAQELENAVANNEADIGSLELTVGDLEARLKALEDDSEIGVLKKELAATDQQVAFCAEVFMFEVMVNGTAIADVVLPYDISELHTTREALRARIKELEV